LEVSSSCYFSQRNGSVTNDLESEVLARVWISVSQQFIIYHCELHQIDITTLGQCCYTLIDVNSISIAIRNRSQMDLLTKTMQLNTR